MRINRYTFRLAIALAVAAAMGASAAEPRTDILLFHGSRPWAASDTTTLLTDARATVTSIDSTLLAGLGGASIKAFPTDKIEPAAKDGISAEFERLGNYRLVIVACIPPPEQERFFTPPRVEKLRQYVGSGGSLLVLEHVPATLNDLLPVELAGPDIRAFARGSACRPTSPLFDGLPDEWPYFGKGRKIAARPAAEILATVVDSQGQPSVPYIATIRMGKGRVGYWNSEWCPQSHFRQLRDWAYFGAVLVRLCSHLCGKPFDSQRVLAHPLVRPETRELKQLDLRVSLPEMLEKDTGYVLPVVNEKPDALEFRFGNGVLLEFDTHRCRAVIVYPGTPSPTVCRLTSPVLAAVNNEMSYRQWDKKTAEAVALPGKTSSSSAGQPIAWRYGRWTPASDGGVQLTLQAGNDSPAPSLQWVFRPIELVIGGRKYAGLGDRVVFGQAACRIEQVRSVAELRIGGSAVGYHRAWRMACYGKPRGFAEIAFSANAPQTTSKWQHFGSGQPFNWLFAPTGIYCEFLDQPAVNFAEILTQRGADGITVRDSLLLGAVTEATTPFMWRVCSPGGPADADAWMMMYQWLRLRFCQKTGLVAPQPQPTSSHRNTCTRQERQATIQAAKQLGFVRHMIPLCPSSLEVLDTPAVAQCYHAIHEAGLRPKPWSPGAYTAGLDNAVAAGHPEWLVREKGGKPLQWFGLHPLFDVNRPDYREHYRDVVDKAAALGMTDLYMDMGGVLSEAVNYASPNPQPCLTGLIEIFRHFSQRGISVGVEGQNALVLDNFWYRQALYENHSGREFAFVGMSPYTNAPDHVSLDYFRLGMHNAFFTCDVSGHACRMEGIPGECRLVEEMGPLNRIFTAALAHVGRPWVRPTACGTLWLSPRGAALFGWHPVANLTLDLPAGWKILRIMTADGSTPQHDAHRALALPSKTVVLLGTALKE